MARKGKREALTFELTPLIDVVFLLLIFFLVSSVFKKEELALLLNLPKATQGKSEKVMKKFITIEMNENKLALNGKNMTMEQLEGELKIIKKEQLVNLRVDGLVRYKKLIKVLDILQKYKLDNISLITDKQMVTK